MDLLKELSDRVLAKYYKEQGKRSLEELVDEAIEDFKNDLLKEINNFSKKEGTSKKANDDVYYLGRRTDKQESKTEQFELPESNLNPNPRDTIISEYCPAKRDVKVNLYMNICQDWQKVKECFGGICGWYPVLDKVPVQEMGVSPKMGKEGEISEDGNIFIVGNERIEVKGKTFAEKLRFLRKALVEKLGIKTAIEVINNWLSKLNEGVDKRSDVINKTSGNIKVGSLEITADMGKRVYVVATKSSVDGINSGWLKEINIYKDGSRLFVCESDEGYLIHVLDDDIVKVTKVCKTWEDGTCKSGNIKRGVLAGSPCCFMLWRQDECECYKID